MGPGYPQSDERAFADVSRGEMDVCAGVDTSMSCIVISDRIQECSIEDGRWCCCVDAIISVRRARA
jgi:hypothetical protein